MSPVEVLTNAGVQMMRSCVDTLRGAGWPAELRVDLDGPGRTLTVVLSVTLPLPDIPESAPPEHPKEPE